MQSDQNIFNNKDIEGVSGTFNVKLKLNSAQKLQIYLQNRDSYETYFVLVKLQDIKRQNIRNHCDFIESASELFQYIGFSLSELGEFSDVIKADSKGKVTIKLQMKIDFRQGSKRKIITYEFQTVKQNLNAIQKLRNQFNTLTLQKLKFQKDIFKRIEDLQVQNKRLKQQLQNDKRGSLSQSKESQLVRYSSMKDKLIIKNNIFLHVANSLNMVLFGQQFTLQSVLEWKIRICNKMVLIFGASTPDLASLQTNALEESIQKQKFMTKEYFNGGQIISCIFQQGELKYIIQKVDIEEDEGSSPQANYNMKRGSFMCKKQGKLDALYACFVLHFGGRVELLSYGKKR